MDGIEIRNYRIEDLGKVVALINAADAVDHLEQATTEADWEHHMGWPGTRPETDCFLAWHGEELVGFADLSVLIGRTGKQTFFEGRGEVHPEWRRKGLGKTLLAMTTRRAEERLPEIERGAVYFHAWAHDVDTSRHRLYESAGMAPVRYAVNLVRAVDDGLPRVEVPAGYRLQAFDPATELEDACRVDNGSFAGDWYFDGVGLDDWRHLVEAPHFRPELCFLAREQASGQAVGLGFSYIDPDWIATTGRIEGYVEILGVLPEHRHRGLGSALLAKSLHVLRGAGMGSVHLHADSENPTGALRLYEQMGFRVRKRSIIYRRVMRET